MHTRRYSSCSSLSPSRACELAVRRGLDLLVFTEHHFRWPEAELDGLRSRYPRLTLLSGQEISLAEGYDVVVLTDAVVVNARYRMDLEELDAFLGPVREESFVFVAHPFRYRDAFTPGLARVLAYVDGIEMNSVNILRNNYRLHDERYSPVNSKRYREARQRYDLIPLFNTDAHSEDALGAVASHLEADAPVRDIPGLVRALRSGMPEQYLDMAALARMLVAQGFLF